MTLPKVAVLGCGAIGGTVLTYLTRGGWPVLGIDPWSEHVYAASRDGFKVDAIEESFTVRPEVVFPDGVAWGARFDVVVLATKGYENRWSAVYARDLLKPDGILLSAQNGLHERYLPEVIGDDRVVGCVVAMGAELVGPGQLKCTTGPERPHFFAGELDARRSDRLDIVASLLGAIGPVEVTDHVWDELWSKMTLNVMSNALAGISGYNVGTLWTAEETTDVIISLAHETSSVARAWGQPVAPIFKTISPELLLASSGPGRPEFGEATRLLQEQGHKRSGMRNNTSSLLQDLNRNRRTEVDYLNGVVAGLGREKGIATPVNDFIRDTVHRVERHEKEAGTQLAKEVHSMVLQLLDG